MYVHAATGAGATCRYRASWPICRLLAAVLRGLSPSAGPPGSSISVLIQGLGGTATTDPFVGDDSSPRLAGVTDLVGVITIGSYVCRQDVDDVASPIEFMTSSSQRSSNTQRINCTLPLPNSHGIDSSAALPEVRSSVMVSALPIQAMQMAIGRLARQPSPLTYIHHRKHYPQSMSWSASPRER